MRLLSQISPLVFVFFGFDAGLESTEHETSMAATIRILDGTGVVVLGGERHSVAQELIHMEPIRPHSVFAETPLTMLLTMTKENNG